ncbi:alpha/beta hydrolase [Oceanicoccus sagamiensis]|uniref:Alpha/beta hydrolase fold-3 domain-containing protein n=1 Tax=Oceanicoccus sagamiensis TaxID=716816 RepID=A0A1X9N8N5_9GAMM|nr:alpha/beta hydrolase [Oceanicoccus sagamiensis]ARN74036.1 hypothetical protein BST96_07835 [Oceanicoccus sagamiensis]
MSWQSTVFNLIFRLQKRTLRKSSYEQAQTKLNKLVAKVELPASTEHRLEALNGVDCEWVIAEPARASEQIILYFHGGAFMVGSPPVTHRHLAAQLSEQSGMKVLLVDYRLTPEHSFPAPVDDGIAVYQWLLANGYDAGQIAFAGDSAGANLLLAVILDARDQNIPLPALAICLSPWADLTHMGNSIDSNKHRDPLLPVNFLAAAAKVYGKGHNLAEPKISPVFADFSGFPPLLVYAGTTEILLNDAERIVAAASAKGVKVESKYWHKQAHAFPILTQYVPEARQAVAGMVTFIRATMQ